MSCANKVLVNPVVVCCVGQPTLTSGCCGNGLGTGPVANVPCAAPAVNVQTGYDADFPPAYAPVQLPWTPATPPATLLPVVPDWAAALYVQYFGLNAIPSTADVSPPLVLSPIWP